MQQMQQQIEILQRRCRSLYMLILVISSTGFAAAWASQAQTAKLSRIKAEAIEIVDSRGAVRVRLGAIDRDAFGLTILDTEGRFLTTLLGGRSRSALRLNESDASLASINLSVQRDGGTVKIRDWDGRPEAVVAVGADGAKVSLWDEQGNLAFAVPKTAER